MCVSVRLLWPGNCWISSRCLIEEFVGLIQFLLRRLTEHADILGNRSWRQLIFRDYQIPDSILGSVGDEAEMLQLFQPLPIQQPLIFGQCWFFQFLLYPGPGGDCDVYF